MVIPMKSRNRPKSLFTSEAQASTMVTLELISTTVFTAARGMSR
jgi:hypothetical protein